MHSVKIRLWHLLLDRYYKENLFAMLILSNLIGQKNQQPIGLLKTGIKNIKDKIIVIVLACSD